MSAITVYFWIMLYLIKIVTLTTHYRLQFSHNLIMGSSSFLGEKLYSCDICFKSFVQSAQLSIHMKRHKGDKPYLCQDCGKGNKHLKVCELH